MTKKLGLELGGTSDELGAKPPSKGADALFVFAVSDVTASGGYFESNKRRSRHGRYRGVGSAPF